MRKIAARRARSGLTMIEVMIVLTVLSIVGVGVGIGLKSSVRIPEASDEALAISAELTSELENWRSVAFSGTAPWPATLNYTLADTAAIHMHGTTVTYPRLTSITMWDPNNIASNATPQANFVRVQITINGKTLAVFLTDPN